MGKGVRIYFVTDDDLLEKVSVARWDRLNNCHPAECFPEYAGKKMRYIIAILETENRKPICFTYTECGHMFFDTEGRRDEDEWHKQLQLVGQGMSWLALDRKDTNVIWAGDWFAQKTYQHKYKWEMTQELLTKLVYEVFP